MQGNQAAINQQVAIALERLNGRMENLETWRVERDDERRRLEDRRDDREEKRPDDKRANLALIVSACAVGLSTLSSCIYVIGYIASHWKP